MISGRRRRRLGPGGSKQVRNPIGCADLEGSEHADSCYRMAVRRDDGSRIVISVILCWAGFVLSSAWLYLNLRRAADVRHHQSSWVSDYGVSDREPQTVAAAGMDLPRMRGTTPRPSATPSRAPIRTSPLPAFAWIALENGQAKRIARRATREKFAHV